LPVACCLLLCCLLLLLFLPLRPLFEVVSCRGVSLLCVGVARGVSIIRVHFASMLLLECSVVQLWSIIECHKDAPYH
jgi:hypothetical protein